MPTDFTYPWMADPWGEVSSLYFSAKQHSYFSGRPGKVPLKSGAERMCCGPAIRDIHGCTYEPSRLREIKSLLQCRPLNPLELSDLFGMVAYIYQPLDPKSQEIRVLHLHPGLRDDPLQISIVHIPFEPADEKYPSVSKMQMQDLRESLQLPEDWDVESTLEGRLIYIRYDEDGTAVSASWQPPNEAQAETSAERATSQPQDFKPMFEAVSYTWGTDASVLTIEVLNSEPNIPATGIATFDISRNLHDMLLQLRDTRLPRVLWIDAICINQQDLVERSEQVRRMRSIYTVADRVIMWTGEAAEDSALALKTLEHIGSQMECTLDHRFIPSPEATETAWWSNDFYVSTEPVAASAISRLVQRPYFERLWVLQEIQLASSRSIVQCGDVTVLWRHVRRAFAKCLPRLAAAPQTSFAMWLKLDITKFTSRDLRSEDTEGLFKVAATYQCSDAKNKVFAILGLLPPTLAKTIESQYSLSVDEVYLQTFLAVSNFTHRLDVFGCAAKPSMEDRPSWVPDFRRPLEQQFVPGQDSLASGISRSSTFYIEPNQLHTDGVHQGEIRAVGSLLTNDFSMAYREFLKLIQVCFPDRSPDDFIDTYAWLITFGDLREKWYEHIYTPPLEEAKVFLLAVHNGNEPQVPERYIEWLGDLSNGQPHGRFFVTDLYRIGYGPPIIEAGDKVCVLLGCRYPTILRPVPAQSSGHEQHTVLGPSYIHGLMEGQALLGPLPQQWTMVVESFYPIRFAFYDPETQDLIRDDPRLGAVRDEWEEIDDMEDETRSVYALDHFRHRESGQVIDSDPRMLPEELRERGVKLERFILV